jgi:hypothetical protein
MARSCRQQQGILGAELRMGAAISADRQSPQTKEWKNIERKEKETMTIAEQLTERIFDTAIDGAIDVGVDFYTVLEALKMTLDTAACLAADEVIESGDPVIDARIEARIEDIARAITGLQQEIAGARNKEKG